MNRIARRRIPDAPDGPVRRVVRELPELLESFRQAWTADSRPTD